MASGAVRRRLTPLRIATGLIALVFAAVLGGAAPAGAADRVKTVEIHYRAHNGASRAAWIVLPAWYGPKDSPPIPLIISPHGRGVSGHANSRIWGTLPAEGPFAVVSPDGQGRLLGRYSWGSAGQIEDLARMPTIVAPRAPLAARRPP